MKKKGTKYEKINTLIGRDVTIEGGLLKASETLRIDGTYIGDIISEGSVCIGETGKVKGNIKTQNILVGGSVEGNITSASETHLATTSTVVGDIFCGNFIVDEGAKFEGRCKMVGSSAAASSSTPKTNKPVQKENPKDNSKEAPTQDKK